MTIKIKKQLRVEDIKLQQQLWEIYDGTLRQVNMATPCRQHCYREEFLKAMKDIDFQKFIVWIDEELGGIGLITNRLEKVPWINPAFFQKKFPTFVDEGLLYYLMGIAVSRGFASRRLGARLLKEMICSLPENGAVAFDHSQAANKTVPVFAERALPKSIKGKILDSQIYRIYQWGR